MPGRLQPAIPNSDGRIHDWNVYLAPALAPDGPNFCCSDGRITFNSASDVLLVYPACLHGIGAELRKSLCV